MSNVLVYSGPGVSSSALHHTLKTLETILPTYDVKTVDARTLALDPWQQVTSLVVLPGGRDLPYVEELGRAYKRADKTFRAYEQLRHYVEHLGGRFWAICAGAYYASAHCSFELGSPIQVDGARPFLRFFPGTCRGTVYPGFVYESDRGARIVDLQLSKPDADPWRCHYNGGGAFMDADQYANQGIEVLARYMPAAEGDDLTLDIDLNDQASAKASTSTIKRPDYAGQAAALISSVGTGKALLFGTHPEFPLLASSRAVQLSAQHEQVAGSSSDSSPERSRKEAELLEHEKRRLRWIVELFNGKLGLRAEIPEWAAASSSAGPADQQVAEDDEPKLLPIVFASLDKSLDPILSSLQQQTAKTKAGSLAHLGPDSVSSQLQGAHFGSYKDSNDSLHFYNGSQEVADTLFKACKQASYEPFNKAVLLPNQGNPTEEKAEGTEEKEVDLDSVPKYLLLYSAKDSATALPGKDVLPYWDISEYQRYLAEFGDKIKQVESSEGGWASWQPSGMAAIFGGGWSGGSSGGDASISSVRIGTPMLYSPMVTSTQTILDKNFRLLSSLPVGTTFFATQQMSGRGRGGNRWISPKGCLQFSTVFRVPLDMAAKTVFLQYLSALAIVEGIRLAVGSSPGGKAVGDKVRIKWPNDVYAEIPRGTEEATRTATFDHGGKRYCKMAGILVNSQFSGGKEFVLISGCGINCLNSRPTTSLSELIEIHNKEHPSEQVEALSQEKLGAAILASFESMWKSFLRHRGDFAPFVARYRHYWLHSDQEVWLDADALAEDGTQVGGEGEQVRIVGISSDHGLLRAVRTTSTVTSADDVRAWGASSSMGAGADVIELQPDGNSFDMLKNMVRRKA